MFEVLKPGLETSVQELPGRIGYWEKGFPPSGPVDSWSFRLANLLAGNDRDAAALECQFIGPMLRFGRDGFVAITGAEMAPTLDGVAIPQWRTHAVRAGQELALGHARSGVRSYIAFAGGIDTPQVLGSRATFHMAGVGGVGGYALKANQTIPLGPLPSTVTLRAVPEADRPAIASPGIRFIECMPGPNDDWLDSAAVDRFFAAEWKVQAKSNRTGIRLTGPEFTFSERALRKRPEHGRDPSNILDHGYPLGAVNLAGQTPIVLINDAPSTGGFINPFTVPSAAFWKLGQLRPNDVLRFTRVALKEAQDLRRALDRLCTPASLVEA
jgi:5-oxoprolinase (ATP-hydrolysing) subunit C